MACDQPATARPGRRARIEGAFQQQGHRHVVGAWIRRPAATAPTAAAGHGTADSAPPSGALGMAAKQASPPRTGGGQFRDRGMVEQVAERYPDAQVAVDAADNLRGLEAVSAQFEEVVVDADARRGRGPRPRCGQRLFLVVARRHIRSRPTPDRTGPAPARRRGPPSRPASAAALGMSGKDGRHHVVGQFLLEDTRVAPAPAAVAAFPAGDR